MISVIVLSLLVAYANAGYLGAPAVATYAAHAPVIAAAPAVSTYSAANVASVAEARAGGSFSYNLKEGGTQAAAVPAAVATYAAPVAAVAHAAPVAAVAHAAPVATYAAPVAHGLGYGYGLHGLGYGYNGLGYGYNGLGYGYNGLGYGLGYAGLHGYGLHAKHFL